MLALKFGWFKMKQYSYSKVDTFEKCPYKYKLKYIDNLETLPDDAADNPLIVGTMVHHAIELGIKKAIEEYLMSYPIITDLHINETIKVELVIPKVLKYLNVLEALNGKFTFEYEINLPDFKGLIDLLEEVSKGYYNIYDFKYSNNIDDYMMSKQLHVYKNKFEKKTGFEVGGLYFIFIPKTMIRQKKTENLYQFRKRIVETLSNMNIQVKKVEFDPLKVAAYNELITEIEAAKEFPKCKSRLCDFCEFKDYCQSEGKTDWMIINKKIEKGEN